MEFLDHYTLTRLTWIGISIFMIGMSKGGFPIGSLAIPLLVLIWPGEQEPAKSAVSFMLPMLCIMDLVAVIFYWKHILWQRIWIMMPGTIAGVVLASILFLARNEAVFTISDNGLKFFIGIIGILFVLYKAGQKWISRRLSAGKAPTIATASVYGVSAGVSSTLAHAASPVIQMYLLPQNLNKLNFAATTAAFFWILNLIKMIPFTINGRIEAHNLKLGGILLPVIPIGVWFGWWLVRVMKPKQYVVFIYGILSVTSVILVIKSFQ